MKRPSAKDRRRFELLTDYGCIICRRPCEIHHIRAGLGMGQRDHSKTIGLCPEHHRHGPGAYHKNKIDFEAQNGSEIELLTITDQILAKISNGA